VLKKFVFKLFRESLVKPYEYSFTILGSVGGVLNKLNRVLVERVGYPKVE
jgi:hypothetical protein